MLKTGNRAEQSLTNESTQKWNNLSHHRFWKTLTKKLLLCLVTTKWRQRYASACVKMNFEFNWIFILKTSNETHKIRQKVWASEISWIKNNISKSTFAAFGLTKRWENCPFSTWKDYMNVCRKIYSMVQTFSLKSIRLLYLLNWLNHFNALP